MENKIMNKDGYCLLTARIFDDFSSGDKKYRLRQWIIGTKVRGILWVI